MSKRNYDTLTFANDYSYTSDSSQTQLNNNIAIVGGSGSGKTMSFIEKRLIDLKNSNAIIKVSKRKLIDKYAPYLAFNGYSVKVLDLVNPNRSTVSFDALDYVTSEQDVMYLAQALVNLDSKKAKSNADPYWDETAILLVKALILLAISVKEDASLADVIKYIKVFKISDETSQIHTNFDNLFDDIADDNPHHPAVVAFNSFRQLPIKTASCVYSTLASSINSIMSDALVEMMGGKNKLDFIEIAQEKTVVFILTSAVAPTLHSFANFIFSTAIKQLFDYAEMMPDSTLPRPLELMFDDFAVGGRIVNFEEYISIFREKKMSATMLLQSESQLASMYGDDNATTILNNCDSYLFLGGNDLATAKNVSLRADVPLDEVMYMPIGDAILFRRGQRPIFSQRYNILADKTYKLITREYEANIRKSEEALKG